MTIALGILAGDGAVLAADSQETIPSYLKVHQGKISGASYSDGSIEGAFAISGSGLAGYLDCIALRLRDRFLEEPGSSVEELEPIFAKEIQDFYEKHVLPFDRYPYLERPSLELLMTAECSRLPQKSHVPLKELPNRLWISEMNTLRRCDPFGAVGAGAFAARILLSQIFPPDLLGVDVATACLLAAYTIFRIKETVDGCGKETQIVYLKSNRYRLVGNEHVTALENLFRYYLELERDAIGYIFGKGLDAESGSLASRLRLFRRQSSKIISNIFDR